MVYIIWFIPPISMVNLGTVDPMLYQDYNQPYVDKVCDPEMAEFRKTN